MFSTAKKHFRIYRYLLKFAMIRETTYRFSFLLELFVELAYILVTFLGVRVIMWNIKEIGGWNLYQMLILLGVSSIFAEILLGVAFIMNLRRLPATIAAGDLDLILTKPLSSQFIVSLWHPYFAMIPSCLPGVGMIWLGFKLGGFAFNLWLILPFLIIFISGLIIGYSLGMMISTLAFWLVNATPLANMAERLIFISERPYSIFTGVWKIVFLFFIPLAFMATFPAKVLLNNFEWWWLGLGVILAVLFLQASRLFWNFGLRHYQSASS